MKENWGLLRYRRITMRREARRRYRYRFLGRRLEGAVREYERANDLEIQEAAALELGVGAQKLSQWIRGQAHPTDEHRPVIAKLGVAWEEVEHLIFIDKLERWRAGADAEELVIAAREIKREEKAQKGAAAASA